MKEDIVAKINSRKWTQHVQAGEEYTKPWLRLNADTVRAYANGKIAAVIQPYSSFAPPAAIGDKVKEVFQNIENKKVLCLASGGGQQSALFGLLGANVTVLDLCDKQLEGDRQSAEYYGYAVRTVQGDMRDLSIFPAEEFDMIYQAVSICFVPDVCDVYKQAFRTLKQGGKYFVGHINPATYPVSFAGGKNGWDGAGYRIAERYQGGAIRKNDNGDETMEGGKITGEFRHLFVDIFCGLTRQGFIIRGVWEDPRHFVDLESQSGSYMHTLSLVQQYFYILCSKPDEGKQV